LHNPDGIPLPMEEAQYVLKSLSVTLRENSAPAVSEICCINFNDLAGSRK